VKAAQSILDEAMRFYKVSPEQRAQSPVEVESYIDYSGFSLLSTRFLPEIQEARDFQS